MDEVTMCEVCALGLLEDIKAGKYELNEAEYQGRDVKLGKPMRGDVKKFKVYVKNDSGNVVKVNFGDTGLSIKRDNPERKKSFRARHKCSQKKDRTSAGYWSCRMWSSKPVSQIVKEDSKTGVMTGTQEKGLNIGLRQINTKQADNFRGITPQTPQSKINYGGCGIFAKLLYYNLRKYFSVTPEIVCFDFPFERALPKGAINKYETLTDYNQAGHSCVHVTVKINDYYLDSTGVHKYEWYTKVYGMPLVEHEGMTIQTLSRWVATGDNWNSTFDRYTTGDINKDMVDMMKQLTVK
jgi:hypothetical protein